MKADAAYLHWTIIGWVIISVIVALMIYGISGIIFPFIFGFFIAYALEPTVSNLQKVGISRSLGTFMMLISFLIIFGSILFVLIPFLTVELVSVAGSLPEYAKRIYAHVLPYMESFSSYIGAEETDKTQQKDTNYLTSLLSWGLTFTEHLLTNTLAIVNLLSLIIITPVVAFFLLRDWPHLKTKMKDFLSRKQLRAFTDLVEEINTTLGSYVRGQSIVCLIMALVYSLALWAVGLKYAIAVGILSGLLSFIPFVGALIGITVGLGFALSQFDTWIPVLMVGGVFAVGITIEGHFLSPQLVGRRVGLHPVWVLFALLAAGNFFGFLGLLIAVPMAAIIGVLVRFAMDRYSEDYLPLADIK
jgi:predicted PurR-regulated permease PerM